MLKLLKQVHLIHRRLVDKEKKARKEKDVSIYVKYWNSKWHIIKEYNDLMEELASKYTQKQIAKKLKIGQPRVSGRLRKLGLCSKGMFK